MVGDGGLYALIPGPLPAHASRAERTIAAGSPLAARASQPLPCGRGWDWWLAGRFLVDLLGGELADRIRFGAVRADDVDDDHGAAHPVRVGVDAEALGIGLCGLIAFRLVGLEDGVVVVLGGVRAEEVRGRVPKGFGDGVVLLSGGIDRWVEVDIGPGSADFPAPRAAGVLGGEGILVLGGACRLAGLRDGQALGTEVWGQISGSLRGGAGVAAIAGVIVVITAGDRDGQREAEE